MLKTSLSVAVYMLRLAVRKELACDNADCVFLSSACTDVREVLLVKAKVLNMNLFCTALRDIG